MPLDHYFNDATGVSLFVESEPSSKHPNASAKPDSIVGDVVIDGASFAMAETTTADGDKHLVAYGVTGDTRWYISILGPASDIEQDFFRQILATFRFPASDFEPLVCAGGSAPLSLSGTGSTTRHNCSVPDGRYSVRWEADGPCQFNVRFVNTSSTDVTAVSAAVTGEMKRGTETSHLPGDTYYLFVEADGCTWTADIAGAP